jgi:hypothetical protein
MDDKVLAARVCALHGKWWEATWLAIAAEENGLTADGCWDSFEEDGDRLLSGAGLDLCLLLKAFDATGDPRDASEETYKEMVEKARICPNGVGEKHTDPLNL